MGRGHCTLLRGSETGGEQPGRRSWSSVGVTRGDGSDWCGTVQTNSGTVEISNTPNRWSVYSESLHKRLHRGQDGAHLAVTQGLSALQSIFHTVVVFSFNKPIGHPRKPHSCQ